MLKQTFTGEYLYAGMQILIDDLIMSESKEDWSNVRSVSRGIRRRKKGFKQNIKIVIVPKTEILSFDGKLLMHSEMLKEFIKKAEQNENFKAN